MGRHDRTVCQIVETESILPILTFKRFFLKPCTFYLISAVLEKRPGKMNQFKYKFMGAY